MYLDHQLLYHMLWAAFPVAQTRTRRAYEVILVTFFLSQRLPWVQLQQSFLLPVREETGRRKPRARGCEGDSESRFHDISEVFVPKGSPASFLSAVEVLFHIFAPRFYLLYMKKNITAKVEILFILFQVSFSPSVCRDLCHSEICVYRSRPCFYMLTKYKCIYKQSMYYL